MLRLAFAMETQEEIAVRHSDQKVSRDRDTGDARGRLISAASALMREKDTIRLSIRQIADRSGLNVSLIGYYFGNKDGLQLATIERDTAFAIAKINAIDPESPPIDRLRNYISIVIEALYEYPYLNRLILAILRDFEDTQAKEIADRILVPLYSCARAIILDGIANGDFRPVDPDLAFFLIQGSCIQIFSSNAAFQFVLKRSPLKPAEVDEFMSLVADVLIRGFANNSIV